MTTMQGIARTNYFRVKDIKAFRDSMNRFDVEVVEEPVNGVPHFAVFDTTNGGSWPVDVEGMGGKLIPVIFPHEISAHLEDGEVAILMGVSYERTRSLRGHALAIDNAGTVRKIELDDIYDEVRLTWGLTVEESGKVQF